MKKFYVAIGDGKGYYGVGYESYLEATELLKISQRHDPKAHIVEEEYHFTNADRIRAMSDEELAEFLDFCENRGYEDASVAVDGHGCMIPMLEWLKQPAKEG